MGFFLLIQSLARHRITWFLLLLLGIVLEGCGLYFQYGLRLPPCVNCVYERAFYLAFVLAGLLGFISAKNFLTRILGTLTLMAGSAGGIYVAFEHVTSAYQTGLGATCKLKASFPSYLPLDEWLPWMFTPSGSCTPLDWSLLGFGMAEWIFASFACGLLVSILFFISEFFRRKRRDYIDFYR